MPGPGPHPFPNVCLVWPDSHGHYISSGREVKKAFAIYYLFSPSSCLPQPGLQNHILRLVEKTIARRNKKEKSCTDYDSLSKIIILLHSFFTA